MELMLKPSQAYDAIVFCNAVSTTEFYSRFYPGLREEWRTKLGDAGLHQIDMVHQSVSMSQLCHWLEYVKPDTLDDLLALFSTVDRLQSLLRTAASNDSQDAIRNLIDRRDTLLRLFEHLKSAGFDAYWRQQVLPTLAEKATNLSNKAGKYDLPRVQQVLNEFLAVNNVALRTHVYITHFTKPIAFQLPGGAMVCNADHLPTLKTLLHTAIHESIHGFPFTEEAQHEQQRLRKRNPAFDNHYQTLMDKFHSGPEEYFVVGAETYLTERLGLRSYEECLTYLDRQNGGMPFAKAIYTLLRQYIPEREPEWTGFGPWLVEHMRKGVFSVGMY